MKMSNSKSIYEMTNTPDKREALENLTDNEKLDIIKQLTDSKSFVEILYYIESADEDSQWCQSYR